MAKRIPYSLVLDFDTSIAAGASAVAKSDVDNDGDFIIEREAFTAWLVTADTAIAGTPAATEATGTKASNTWMTNAHFRIERKITDTIFQNAPIRVSNLIRPNGDGFDLTQRRISKGQTLSATLYNDSAQIVKAQYVLHGFKLIED